MSRRFDESRVHGEGRSSIAILLDRAAEMERWASMEDRFARNARRQSDWEAAHAEAKKWRSEAAKLIEKALKEEEESAANPARFTGFEIHTSRREQLGRALPITFKGKGAAATSRAQAKRKRY